MATYVDTQSIVCPSYPLRCCSIPTPPPGGELEIHEIEELLSHALSARLGNYIHQLMEHTADSKI